jgi:hypothetical protein
MFANQQITELPLTWRDKEWSEDLRRVLAKATESDPRARQQSVDEFWHDLEPVRRIAYDMETLTGVRPNLHETPQPHVARGYSPLVPQQPRFDTSRELKLKHAFGPVANAERGTLANAERGMRNAESEVRRAEVIVGGGGLKYPAWEPRQTAFQPAVPVDPTSDVETPPDEFRTPRSAFRIFGRRFAVFAILLIIFAGGLYGTSAFLRSRGILPAISNPFAAKTGHANTDINLRPEPNANNDPIGMVTKDSKVRIIKTQNNWYQVDVLEQGRERDTPLPTNRGWLNGKYVDLD